MTSDYLPMYVGNAVEGEGESRHVLPASVTSVTSVTSTGHLRRGATYYGGRTYAEFVEWWHDSVTPENESAMVVEHYRDLMRALNHERHNRETLAVAAEGLSNRESVRKVRRLSRLAPDLMPAVLAGEVSVEAAHNELRRREGKRVTKRTTIDVEDPRAAVRTLLRYFHPDDVYAALMEAVAP